MAGGRPVGEKPTLRVEQSAFADGHLPTDMQRLALPADDPGIGGHRSCEVNLVFERDRREAWLERSYDGCCHTGIEQDGRVATMDESQGIVVLCRRYRGEHDEPRLGSLDVDIEKLEHRRTRQGTLHERFEVFKTRESGNTLVCGRIHGFYAATRSRSIITVFRSMRPPPRRSGVPPSCPNRRLAKRIPLASMNCVGAVTCRYVMLRSSRSALVSAKSVIRRARYSEVLRPLKVR